MTSVEDIYKEISTIMNQIEGEDAINEVAEEYVAYDNTTTLLLGAQDLESYLVEYEKICTDDTALIECFNSKNSQELKTYIEEKNISLSDLKVETVVGLREAVKFLIYEAEDDDY